MSQKGTGKFFWGPSLWKTIHSLAAAYTPDQKGHYKTFIYGLQYMLPCEFCRVHLQKNLKMLKIDDYLDNNHTLFLWTYFLHDMVNRQLGKISPPFDAVKSAYFKGMGPECTSCKLN